MAKTKRPLFSFGASGTIGDALTFQRIHHTDIAREKPIPRDPYSLNQAYQRWDYRDYAYQWTLLSNSEKQIYRTKASRYHITGFSQWMREQLNDLPDLAGRWRLDERAGAIAYDSSKNNNNGTIYGATPVKGVIDNALYFDGVDNKIIVPHSPTLIHLIFTVMCFVTFDTLPSVQVKWCALITKYEISKGFSLEGRKDDDSLALTLGDDAFFQTTRTPFTIELGRTYHLAATYGPAGTILYVDGLSVATNPAVGYVTSNANLTMGWAATHHNYSQFHLDNPLFYNRILTPTEIKRHSERRYP